MLAGGGGGAAGAEPLCTCGGEGRALPRVGGAGLGGAGRGWAGRGQVGCARLGHAQWTRREMASGAHQPAEPGSGKGLVAAMDHSAGKRC